MLSASSLSLLLLRDIGLMEFARIFGGASILKSIPTPCPGRAFLIGASGGSAGTETALATGAS